MQPGWAGAAVRIQDFHEPRELDVRGFEQRHFHPVVVAHDVDRPDGIQRDQAEDAVDADFSGRARKVALDGRELVRRLRRAETWTPVILLTKIDESFERVAALDEGDFELLRRAVDEHFMRPQHAALWTVASTPAEAVELIFSEPVWDANIRKLALV